MATYKGVSFKNWQEDKTLILTDVELVKRDLLNHIFTIRGERVGQREFGTTIQNMLFEPYTDNNVTIIVDQVKQVLNFDPRIILINTTDLVVNEYPNESFLQIKARLFFVELNLIDILDINLEFES